MSSYADLFVSALATDLRPRWQGRAQLDAELDNALRAGIARWPTLTLDADLFVGYLATRIGESPQEAAFAYAAELYLACAIVQGRAEAMGLFESEYVKGVAVAVHRFRLAPDDLDELKQRLRAQLLMSETGGPAKIFDYSGLGPLAAWLRVAAVRLAIKMTKNRADHSGDEDLLEDLAVLEPSPEQRFLTKENQAAFRECLRRAIITLEPQEQNVVRQHYLDGLTLDQLGALYRVHRTTVAYWIERARDRLFKRTRLALLEKLSASECDSLFSHAQSQLDTTLRGLFKA